MADTAYEDTGHVLDLGLGIARDREELLVVRGNEFVVKGEASVVKGQGIRWKWRVSVNASETKLVRGLRERRYVGEGWEKGRKQKQKRKYLIRLFVSQMITDQPVNYFLNKSCSIKLFCLQYGVESYHDCLW